MKKIRKTNCHNKIKRNLNKSTKNRDTAQILKILKMMRIKVEAQVQTTA